MAVFLIILFLGTGLLLFAKNRKDDTVRIPAPQVSTTAIPTPTPTGPYQYQIPKISKKDKYQIMLLGDSMMHALGPHGGVFNEEMNNLYRPHNIAILIDNYAEPSKNILTINEQMNRKQQYWDVSLEPMMTREFDMVMIESFGYNPLSQFPREEGLQKQTEILDETVRTLMRERPNAVIVFVATIAPSRENFAKSISGISQEDRIKQIEERIAFIQNHIEFALRHNIPIINIFENSKLPSGDGNTEYINPDDDIHPSAVGLIFMGREMTNFLENSQIFPK